MHQRGLQDQAVIGLLILSLFPFSPYLPDLSHAAASNRPSWTEQAMFRFGDDVFFVGQASCAKTSEEGRQRAFVHGIQEILNYAQAPSLEGVPVATQMVFEDFDDPRCPPSSTTTWRLLRVGSIELAQLSKRIRSQRHAPLQEQPRLSAWHLQPGMMRGKVLEKLGRPASIEIGRDGSSVMHYESLTLFIGSNGRLLEWRSTHPPANTGSPDQTKTDRERAAEPPDLPAPAFNDQSKLPQLNIVYNGARFANPKIVVTRWHGDWPACVLLDQNEITPQRAEELRAPFPSWEPLPARMWPVASEHRPSKPRTSGLWTCTEAQLFVPNPRDCRPW